MHGAVGVDLGVDGDGGAASVAKLRGKEAGAMAAPAPEALARVPRLPCNRLDGNDLPVSAFRRTAVCPWGRASTRNGIAINVPAWAWAGACSATSAV